MDNLIFIACVEMADAYSGITRKVKSQFSCIGQRGGASLVAYSNNDIYVNNGEELVVKAQARRRKALISYVNNYVQQNKPECAYIRRMPLNFSVLKMLKTLRENGAKKIIWEIPTYPYDHEKHSTIAFFHLLEDKFLRRSLKKYVDRIVTFAPEDEIFGIATIRTGNGIDVDSVRVRTLDSHGDELRLIAAAVLNDWHGYDRLIRGLAEYEGERKVVFHLIGEGPCYEEYKALAKELNVEDSVVFYGSKTKAEVEDIYDICDMAVESLGWHRSQVTMGTSLKTREYVAKGMPILASTPMDIFPDGWEYAYYAPIDDSAIDIQAVVDFYSAITAGKDIKEFANEIRRIAYERCDMKAMMKPIIDFYNMEDKR